MNLVECFSWRQERFENGIKVGKGEENVRRAD